MRNRNVASRSALGRSDRRETISTVGRTVGGLDVAGARARLDVAPPVVATSPGRSRLSSAHATRDHAARAVEGPDVDRESASSSGPRSPHATATSAMTSHRPRCRSAPRSTARAGAAWTRFCGDGTSRASGTKISAHSVRRWLSLIIGASDARWFPFASPRATRAVSAAKARCALCPAATFASSGPSDGSVEKHAAESAAAPPAESRTSARLRSGVTLLSRASPSARRHAP